MSKKVSYMDSVPYDEEINVDDWIKDQEWYNPTLLYVYDLRHHCNCYEIFEVI
jgi:hypothetical protein